MMAAINLGNVRGATGATGATGAKGDKGDKGDTGATGITGEWSSLFPVFGQPKNKISELNDLLYQSYFRFGVTSNIPFYNVLFDGSNETSSLTNVGVSTGNYVEVDIRNKQGFDSSGLLYPAGELVVSFFADYHNVSNISVTITHSYNATPTALVITDYVNISSDINFKVLKFLIPNNINYVGKIRLDFDSTGNTSVASITYLLDRYAGTPLPYVNSYINKNWVYGTLVVNDKVELNNNGFIGAYSDADVLAKFGQDSANTYSRQLLIENNSAINYLGIRAIHNNVAHDQPITFQYYGGNVGFGAIITPTEKVDIAGNIRVRGAIIDSTGSAGLNGQVLKNVAGLPVWSNP